LTCGTHIGQRGVPLVVVHCALCSTPSASTADLGIDENVAREIASGYTRSHDLAAGSGRRARLRARLDEILVVEEKRQILEYQVKEELYNLKTTSVRAWSASSTTPANGPQPTAPHGDWLLPATYELNPAQIARAIATRIRSISGRPSGRTARQGTHHLPGSEGGTAESGHQAQSETDRIPHFCSGCPHNSSTKVPEGSRALAGIAATTWCSGWTARLDLHPHGRGRRDLGRHAPFTNEQHVFSNLGDGTYFHSGLLGDPRRGLGNVNITYKLLYNDAVAMTGGQVVDGPLDPARLSRQIAAEGVSPIIVVTDEPDKYPDDYDWAPGVTVRHRSELEAVQRELREVKGVSAMIYDQTCASEKRRRRKKNEYPDPAKRAVINRQCAKAAATAACSRTACRSSRWRPNSAASARSTNRPATRTSPASPLLPSFVTVEGGQLKKPKKAGAGDSADPTTAALPTPIIPTTQQPFGILVTGIGAPAWSRSARSLPWRPTSKARAARCRHERSGAKAAR